LLELGIQVDTDANHGDVKRITVFAVYHHAVPPVIIQDPVVDPPGCRTLAVDSLIGLCATGNIRI